MKQVPAHIHLYKGKCPNNSSNGIHSLLTHQKKENISRNPLCDIRRSRPQSLVPILSYYTPTLKRQEPSVCYEGFLTPLVIASLHLSVCWDLVYYTLEMMIFCLNPEETACL